MISIIEKARLDAQDTFGSMNGGMAAWYADKLLEAGVVSRDVAEQYKQERDMLADQLAGKWIPVTERLPNVNKTEYDYEQVKEYIERDAARNALYQYLIEQTESKYPSRELCIAARSGVSEAMAVLEYASAADVVPVVHGEWIPVPSSDMAVRKLYKCSNCKRMRYGVRLPPYCQECGAKMDGGKE